MANKITYQRKKIGDKFLANNANEVIDVVNFNADALDAVAEGTPRGTYADLAALIAANPDHTYTYITLDNGNWNYYNGSAFVSGGMYLSTADSASKDELLTVQNAAIVTVSKNLFKKDTITTGAYIDITNVNLTVANEAWFTSGFINIEQFPTIASDLFGYYGFYDENKLGISGGLGNTVNHLDKVVGAKYFKNSNTIDVLDSMMIEGASTPSFTYEPQQLIESESIKNIPVGKLDFALSNLFDKTKRTDNVYLELSGSLTSNTAWFTSDFIDATIAPKYAFNKGGFIGFYNNTPEYISGIRLVADEFLVTIPENCDRLRFSLPKTELYTCMCEAGEVVHGYMEFGSPVIPIAKIEVKREIKTTEIVVKSGGTVGVNCEFTDILSAIDSISGNDYFNRYVIKIMNGNYYGSDDGHTRWGLKNYVTYRGQSKSGVNVVRRNSTFSSENAVFDPNVYGEAIEYASVENMSCFSFNGKSPIHVDCNYTQFAKGGTIEIINCDLVNENTPEMLHYQNGLACGLRIGQRVVARGVNSNGQLWVHDADQTQTEVTDGCTFELYGCRFPFTEIADTYSSWRNKFVMYGCKTNKLIFSLSNPFTRSTESVNWAWDCDLQGNQIGQIVGKLYDAPDENQAFWDACFGGKFGIQDSNIHMYCKNNSDSAIDAYLVALDTNYDEVSIKNWELGDKLYGMALDTIAGGEYGTVQYSGILSLYANGSTPILFNDELELNSDGQAIKRIAGDLVGYAMDAVSSGLAIIRMKMV